MHWNIFFSTLLGGFTMHICLDMLYFIECFIFVKCLNYNLTLVLVRFTKKFVLEIFGQIFIHNM